MSRLTRGRTTWLNWVFVFVALLCASADPAWAQPGTTTPAPSPPDFRFEPPKMTLGIRGGYVQPREGSDVFDFVRDLLTIDKGGFGGPLFATDIGIAVHPRFEIVTGYEFSRGLARSEYLDYVDGDDLPIEQESSLRQHGLNAGVRFLLTPRARSIGRLAWVPSRFTPYVGAGGGVVWWRFMQDGDFVDFHDLGIFTETFESRGVAPTIHALGGLEVRAARWLNLAVEGRYQWSSGRLGGDFVGFDPIDLSGFRVSGGITLLF